MPTHEVQHPTIKLFLDSGVNFRKHGDCLFQTSHPNVQVPHFRPKVSEIILESQYRVEERGLRFAHAITSQLEKVVWQCDKLLTLQG